MKKTIFCILMLLPSLIFAQSAKEIIKKVDRNQLYKTQKFSATMTIIKGNKKQTKKFHGYGKKYKDSSFMRFTNPEDKDVKYLKVADQLWIYFPDADDIMKISGHMLRKGMMGSDLSYQDMMETSSCEKKYSIKLQGKKVINGVECFVIDCKAKVKNVAYDRQVLYVDTKRFIALKIEMYARGGRLIKEITQHDIRKIGWRYVPRSLEIKDTRKRNSKTIIKFRTIKYDVKIPSSVFKKHYLRR